ncbi:MAG: DUF411 domain-containing protein [bacterium]|nr:DUF411 domain-containing protein [bacterium]
MTTPNPTIDLKRRQLLAGALLLALPRTWAAPGRLLVEVWKDPTCGCCKDWIAHLEKNGFEARVHDTGNTAARQRLGIPSQYGSCHTAVVDGYALEGHVPVREILRLLNERPNAIGLAVPGMPIGSPGMDGPEYGRRRDPYDVLLLARDGTSRIFQSYR